ncbi:MAG: baeRF10 domain-containing protein [Actinomycetota bacterium]
MSDLDHRLLRTLAARATHGAPITSVYLTVDGKRYPRRSDYEVRLDELLRSARAQASALGKDAARSVERDVAAMSEFVRDRLERDDTRGIALFSSHAEGLWETVLLPRPVRDRAVVAAEPDLRPLEALLETYRPTCVALVDFAKARVFVVELGRIEEVSDLADDVPNRHEQGGSAQMRMQRHVDDHRIKHLKHVADDLFALSRRRAFEHLVLAGPAEAHRELESALHDYLRQRIRASVTMPMTASRADVLARVLELDEEAEHERERAAAERLAQAAGSDDRGVLGLEATLEALANGRVAELMVSIDLSSAGSVCEACGRLSTAEGPCATCGGESRAVPDVVEAAVAAALRSGARVETVVGDGLAEMGRIGALLRF